MKTRRLYFDLIGGISGDMIVGSLLDLGADFKKLEAELKKIRVSGFRVKRKNVQRQHVKAKKFDVIITSDKNYSYNEIITIFKKSSLKRSVKNNIFKIYEALRAVETKIHGHKHSNIRFHQLGEIDSIVDIASVCICLDLLGIEEIVYSMIPLNKKVCPATFELITDKKVFFTEETYENVTPTGMAVLTALGCQSGNSLKVVLPGRCGYGAGSADPLNVSNVLRSVELKDNIDSFFEKDEIIVIEADIDDMVPQVFDYIYDKLFKAGALDVFVHCIQMKKNRPGFLLTVLSKRENLGIMTRLVFTETTTSGVRFYPVSRLKLPRSMSHVVYGGHKARVKIIDVPGGGVRVIPEYDDCKAIAQKTNKPILKIFNEIKNKAGLKWRSRD